MRLLAEGTLDAINPACSVRAGSFAELFALVFWHRSSLSGHSPQWLLANVFCQTGNLCRDREIMGCYYKVLLYSLVINY